MRNLTICSKLAVLPQPTINLSINQFSSLLYQLLRSRQKLSQSQFQATRWYRFSESVLVFSTSNVCLSGGCQGNNCCKHAAHSDEAHRSCSKEAHGEPPFPFRPRFFHQKPFTDHQRPKVLQNANKTREKL